MSISSCGNLEDFNKKIEYPPVRPNSNGLTNVSQGVRFADNKGVSLLAYYIPSRKAQSDSALAMTLKGLAKFSYKDDNVTSNSINTLHLPHNTVKSPATDENFLRNMENQLLQNPPPISSTSLFTKSQRKKTTFQVGELWPTGFIVFDDLNNSQTKRTTQAICVAVTENAYIFSETAIQKDDEAIKVYADKFDSIYQSIHQNFGSENDTDGNGKVIVLIFDMKNESTLGYFYSADKYPKTQVASSNEADIFYINSYFAYNKPQHYTDTLSSLAHELQHMVYFDIKYNKISSGITSLEAYIGDVWLNEGLSMLSEYLAGYNKNVNSWFNSFLRGGYKNLSLTYWTNNNYGFSGLFTRYLYEKSGADTVRNIYAANSGGINAVERLLNKDFNNIFNDFIQTIYLSAENITTDPFYNFSSIDLSKYKINYTTPDDKGDVPLTLFPYGITFAKTSKNTEKLFIQNNITGYAILHND